MAVFKIASGYVEVKGVVDRVSVRQAADRFTRDVADQMDTGVAFANSREGGRTMGTIYGQHAAPEAARGLSSGMLQWIGQGTAASDARAAGGVFGTHMGAGARDSFGAELTFGLDAWSTSEATHESGRKVGKTLGEHITEEITKATETFIDKNGRERDSNGRFVGGGGESGGIPGNGKNAEDRGRTDGDRYSKSFLERMTDALGSGFHTAFTSAASIAAPVLGTVGALLAVPIVMTATASIAAGIGAAIIGGAGLGVIGIGALILRDNEKVQQGAARLKKQFKDTMTEAAQPLVQPFVDAMGVLQWLLVDIGPDLKSMFESIAPAIVPLTEGFAEFVKAVLPGFMELVKAAEPFLQDLALTLPRLGEDIGMFLSFIAGEGPAATLFFRDFLNILGLLIQGAGVWIGFFAMLYGAISGFFHDSKEVIMGVIDWTADVVFWIEDKLRHFKDLSVAMFVAVVQDGGKKFIGWVKSIPGDINDALGGIPGILLRPFNGIGNMLWNAGKDLINGLIRGIKSAVPALEDTLGWITDKLPDWKGPEQKDKDVLYNSGRYVMQGFERGVRDETYGGVEHTLGALTSRLPSLVAPTSSAPGGPMIGTLQINISSTLDDPELPRVVAARIYDAIETYKKDYS